MFDVYGDDIILENVKVGELKGGWPTLRDRAIDYLKGTIDGYVEEGVHQEEVEEAYQRGYLEGAEEAKLELRPEVERELQAAYALGYEQAKRDLWVTK